MRLDNQTMGVLFLVVIIILAVIPKIVHQFYNTILGRVLLISIVIYFTMNNMTLGLLMALVIIAATNQFSPLTEGMTIGDDNEEVSQDGNKKSVDEIKKSLDENKKNVDENKGVDKEDIKIAVMSKQSNSIPVSSNTTSSTEVSASTEGMLGGSKLEGFASF